MHRVEKRRVQMVEKVRNDSPDVLRSNGNGRLMSIRDVSALTDVPPHTIRFWEKEMPNILRPERTPGGQRRYDEEAADRIRMIKRLSAEKGYSLATIREYLSATEGFSRLQSNLKEDAHAEHAIQLIVDEITDVLKERLRILLSKGI
jgi:DNA-binding transcriptional MerR regulator